MVNRTNVRWVVFGTVGVLFLLAACSYIIGQNAKDDAAGELLERSEELPRNKEGLSELLFLMTLPYADSVVHGSLQAAVELAEQTDPDCSMPLLKSAFAEHIKVDAYGG